MVASVPSSPVADIASRPTPSPLSSSNARSVTSSPFCSKYCFTTLEAKKKASHIETRVFLSRSAAGAFSACTNPSANTVAYFCAGVLVDVMMIRRSPVSPAANGKLALELLTKTTRDRMGVSTAFQSATVRSGPTRLNFAVVPSAVPCPISMTNRTSSGLRVFARRSNVARTFSAVARCSPSPACSAITVSCDASILNFSRNVVAS